MLTETNQSIGARPTLCIELQGNATLENTTLGKTTCIETNCSKMISRILIALVTFGSVCLLDANILKAYTPEDAVVKQMVNRGCAYLEGLPASKDAGETAFRAYAHYKAKHNESAPIVVAGIKAAKGIITDAAGGGHHHKINYDTSVATLLLAAIDANGNRSYLEKSQKYFNSVQLGHGGFSYPEEANGDVSQVQYVLLAIWTLDRAGLPLDYDRVAKAMKWLLRVQDLRGTWPYHGVDPGPGKPLQRQEKVGYSMALAGASSLLIAGDALRIWGDTVDDDKDPKIPGLPKAIKLYVEDKNVDRRKRSAISKEPIFRSIGLMEAWKKQNPYKRTSMLDWYYYQLYTQERYESFIEIANARAKDKSPAWYNRGVEELKKYQGGDGGWSDRSHSPPPISTCFAILFLVRSTQKAIFTIVGGGSIGGQGFGKDVEKAKLVGGKAQGPKSNETMADLLKLLEDEDADVNGGKSVPEALVLSGKDKPADRAAELDRLERLLRGSRSWQARRVAAKTLGKSDEMRVVPAMIYALSDGDDSVKMYARDGLRFISRKFDGFGMPDKPDYAEQSEAQRQWRDWYRTMKPGYEFLDD